MTPAERFAAANEQRRVAGAERTIPAVRDALAILGTACPVEWRALAEHRIAHPGMSLQQLADAAEPPISKDKARGILRMLVEKAAKVRKRNQVHT